MRKKLKPMGYVQNLDSENLDLSQLSVVDAIESIAKTTISYIGELKQVIYKLEQEIGKKNETLDRMSSRLDKSKAAQMVDRAEMEFRIVKEINASQAETIASLVAERKMWKAQIKLQEMKQV